MAVTCYFSGRWGNIVFNSAMLIAYAKRHDLEYFVPTEAKAYNHFKNGDISVPYKIRSTGERPTNPIRYYEPGNKKTDNPYYHDIPKMDNVMFIGYYQSFKYFDWCRDHILETFNLPYNKEDVTGISVRRGDCINSPNFPIAPLEYYEKAVAYMQSKGFNRFRLYSDDIPYCKEHFVSEKFNGAEFTFSEGNGEIEDYISLSSCANQITARSTFSLTAAWFNRNHYKIVCVPTTRHRYWRSQNLDLIPEYFTQIDFENPF